MVARSQRTHPACRAAPSIAKEVICLDAIAMILKLTAAVMALLREVVSFAKTLRKHKEEER